MQHDKYQLVVFVERIDGAWRSETKVDPLSRIHVVAQKRRVRREELPAQLAYTAGRQGAQLTSARVPTFHPRFCMIGLTCEAIFSSRGLYVLSSEFRRQRRESD